MPRRYRLATAYRGRARPRCCARPRAPRTTATARGRGRIASCDGLRGRSRWAARCERRKPSLHTNRDDTRAAATRATMFRHHRSSARQPAMRNNIGLLLAKRALLSPNLDGLVEVERERRFTFAGLNARANRAANALRALGVRKGDRVALLLMNGVEFSASFFAIAKIGAVIVPLNWRLVAD